MFDSHLETIKFAVFDTFGWVGSFLEGLVSLIYGSLFGVSFIMLFLIGIILFLIIRFTIRDMSVNKNSSMSGGSKKDKIR